MWGPLAVNAGVVEYSATFDQVSGTTLSSSIPLPTFTGDFSVDKQLRVTFSAPTGKKFDFVPSGPGKHILADIWSVGAVNVSYSTAGVSVTFTDLQGGLASQTQFEALWGPANDFTAILYGEVAAGGISFSSISMLFDVPATYNASFNNHTLDPVRFSLFDGGATGSVAISDIQVPEPATIALMGLGLAGIGFARKKKQA